MEQWLFSHLFNKHLWSISCEPGNAYWAGRTQRYEQPVLFSDGSGKTACWSEAVCAVSWSEPRRALERDNWLWTATALPETEESLGRQH